MKREEAPKTALAEIAEEYSFPTAAIVSMPEVLQSERKRCLNGEMLGRINAYYDQYGPKE